MATSAKHGPEVLRYLRSIDAKLDRLNKRLDNFLSAPERKRAARTELGERREHVLGGDAGKPVLTAGTPEHAEELRKKNPDATIIITGVPRAKDSIVKSRKNPRTK